MTESNPTVTKAQLNFIVLLKFAACLLIINSHCREIYPYFFLAVGGGHGNALFFIISGYCLANIKPGFLDWYLKRVRRIIPAALLMMTVGLALNYGAGIVDSRQSGLQFVADRYWFIWAIMIYYVLFYWVVKNSQIKRLLIFLLIYFTGYVLLYTFCIDKSQFCMEPEGFSWFKVYFYFGIMLTGGILKKIGQPEMKPETIRKKLFLPLVILIMIAGITWAAEYWMIFIKGTGYGIQFFIHLSVYVFTVSVFLLFLSCENLIDPNNAFFRKCVTPVAQSTLEIYLVQVSLIFIVLGFAFPVNWLMFVLISIGGGLLLHKAVSKIPLTGSR
ncbi:MAG: acyltransferase family protein [Clostridia bacterium]|nr:acyltransferase family protein [Clostridia bacterium]